MEGIISVIRAMWQLLACILVSIWRIIFCVLADNITQL